jgi:hypothetical protein
MSLRSSYNVGTHVVWIAAVWGQFCLPDLPDGIPLTFSPCSAASLLGASKRYSMKVTRRSYERLGGASEKWKAFVRPRML